MAVEESGSRAGQGGLAALTANLSLGQISHTKISSRLKTHLPPALLSYAPPTPPLSAYPAHPSLASNLRSPPPAPQLPTSDTSLISRYARSLFLALFLFFVFFFKIYFLGWLCSFPETNRTWSSSMSEFWSPEVISSDFNVFFALYFHVKMITLSKYRERN
ncbi:hypothetical protein TorRG33x02_154740 [Trema orientale]|uniref:Transmembrane protein n=1 Tax=Trema orientale TaxID=63057 RepID=A0A2P5ET92_TREOI|nr:hypothetical protein TorRG33x02_154740 [Trema orientale]